MKLMDINFSDEDNQFRQEVKDYLENKYPKHVKEKQNNGEQLTKQDMIDYHKSLYEQGWAGYNWPVEYGGTGWSPTQIYIFQEELGYANTPTILPFGLNMVGPVIYTFGNEEQKLKWLPKLATGEWLGAWGLTEPGTGSDAKGMNATAKKEGDHWVLNGTKNFITHGISADVAVVIFRTGEKGDSHGMTAFVIERGTPGFSSGKKEDKLGMRASETAELIFDQCRVPDENRLGELGDGFIQSMKILDGGRISIAALSLGIARGAYEA